VRLRFPAQILGVYGSYAYRDRGHQTCIVKSSSTSVNKHNIIFHKANFYLSCAVLSFNGQCKEIMSADLK
jgi:hypothetical protein